LHHRLTAEQAFHDRQAHERAVSGLDRPADLRFSDAAYLDHESWIAPALAQLGELRGRRVLDFGCGHGMAAVVMARRGAQVMAFDLSAGYLAEAGRRARANGVCVHGIQADGKRLPFADSSFDGVWGNAILHHLDLRRAAPELARILRPEGVAVFCEPWGENRLLGWARRRLPYAGKQRTEDEEPLRRRDVDVLRTVFARVEVRGYQLLSMARRVLPTRRLVPILERCDNVLLSRIPSLETYCRYVVITLRRIPYNG
jgi:SAM-dependent methyltransferase